MTDAEFLTAFENRTLPRPFWTHEAHVRMAFLYLRGLPDATLILPIVRQRIRCYNEANGNATGYHETITVAFLALVADRIRQSISDTPSTVDSWDAFRVAHADLITSGINIILAHYSRETLFSAEARATFVAPDIVPLP